MSERHMDAETVELWVHTRKEGVLSRVGHDLRLRAARLQLCLDEASGSVRFSMPADALRVVGALEGETVRPGALSERDRAQIERHAREDVLEARRYPTIRFDGRMQGEEPERSIEGQLELHGRSRPLRVDVRQEGACWVGRVRFDQRDWGIRPFKAPLGVLKVRPEVEVVVRVPIE